MKKGEEEFLYERELRALSEAGINYVVCGGAAVVIFGFARLTVDMDLIVSLEKENLSKLYDTLLNLGYKTRVPIRRDEFIRREKLLKLAEEKDNFKTIDIGVNLPGIDKILKRKKFIKAGNFNIPIIFIDDLIKMKEDLARPKDIIDAENLKKIREKQNEKEQ